MGRRVIISFTWPEINHLRKIVKLAQSNGHENCGWCDKILQRINEKIISQKQLQQKRDARVSPRNYYEKLLLNPYRKL